MRHKKLNKKFGRNRSARQALIRDLAIAALKYESITTTSVKAKESRKLVEKLITLGKEGSLHSKRLAYKELCDHKLVSLLFNDIAKRFVSRSGGYTRIYSLLARRGDGAEQVMLELTERKEKPKKIKSDKKEKQKKEKPSEAAMGQETGAELSAEKEVKKETAPAQKLEAAEAKKEIRPEAGEGKKPQREEKAQQVKEKSKHRKEEKPSPKFLVGLRKIFKKERDSL